ncbi:MAG: ImmA/IrrE family metallo-endopeptidase [Defluviitaleaceae bacterium]|nr:ImmA/IrrE family metallo-endopeptidase [Defluviitaleaceae bacterium]
MNNNVNEILQNLEDGVKGIFESSDYQNYLNTLSKFHNYSLNNTMLIHSQKSDASYVAGFNTWTTKFNRQVQKGEKGIKILAPLVYKTEKENIETGEITEGKAIKGFKITTVFDISQTKGDPLTSIDLEQLEGGVEDYKRIFDTLRKISPVPIAFESITSGVKGYYSHIDKRIAINEGMSELQSIKTTIHEMAHTILHDKDIVDRDLLLDSETKEVQAESVAYTVCSHFGLGVSEYSFGYIAGWSQEKDNKTLKSSLDVIKKNIK